MRTFGVLILIIIILVSVSVYENKVVSDFCDDIDFQISTLRDDAGKKIINRETVEKIKNIWEKHKTKIFVFKNHNAFSDYEDAIVDLEFSVKTNDVNKLYYTSYRFNDINKRLKDSGLFNIGNIF